MKYGHRNFIYSYPDVVLNTIFSILSEVKYRNMFDINPYRREKIIIFLNIFFTFERLLVFLDISGSRAVDMAFKRNVGTTNSPITYVL